MYYLTPHTEGPILPGMAKVEVLAWKCERCEHVWLGRDMSQPPKVCPKCKSPYWDRPRRKESTGPVAKKSTSTRTASARADR